MPSLYLGGWPEGTHGEMELIAEKYRDQAAPLQSLGGGFFPGSQHAWA